MQVQSSTGIPAGKRPGGGLKGMTGAAYLQRSRQLIGRIQQLQREHRLKPLKGARDDGAEIRHQRR